MKKISALFLFFTLFCAASSYAQTTVEIVNQAGVDIYSIFASDVNNTAWGEDLLGADVLAPGQKIEITFPEGYNCKVDIKASADADDQDSISFDNVDICEVSGIILKGNGKYSVY
jgi:hypothetical protein